MPVIARHRLGAVLVVVPLLLSLTAIADDASEDPPKPGAIPWSSVAEPEQRLVTSVLESRHWPRRVLALMRIERYRGPELEPIIRARLTDDTWQVRCFALRAAWRLRIAIAPADLASETDGRVIRTALGHGVRLSGKRIETDTKRLMRAKSDDEMILGLEIAAASDIESLRKEARRRTRLIFKQLNETALLRIARRLARIVGMPAADADSVDAWRDWYASIDGRIELADPAPEPPRAEPPNLPLVAELDAERFSRLVAYLDVLKENDLEIAIVMDATTSMVPMINEARAGVESLILFLADLAHTMRLAVIAYRDHDNPPITEGAAFTTDVDRMRGFLYGIRITGGRDLPEAVLEGLTACGRLRWSREAIRQIVLVGDARPHDEDMYKITSLLDSYRSQGVTVHAVHVPMELHPAYARLDPQRVRDREAEIADHNTATATAFDEIARLGGGEKVTLHEVPDLVPSIMHLSIEPVWRPAFDEFYALYLELCR